TAAGIPLWSPTRVLICRSTAYVWQSGRDAQFSADCGRTCWMCLFRQNISTPHAVASDSILEKAITDKTKDDLA
ncbi:hypothetical protein KCU89_g12279, partial [Aureobasidium melanogenum]